MKLYHAMKREHGVFAARSLVRKFLTKNNGNVFQTANELGCSRRCVRRARDGTLDDKDRTPHHQPNKIEDNLEQFVLKIRKEIGYGTPLVQLLRVEPKCLKQQIVIDSTNIDKIPALKPLEPLWKVAPT